MIPRGSKGAPSFLAPRSLRDGRRFCGPSAFAASRDLRFCGARLSRDSGRMSSAPFPVETLRAAPILIGGPTASGKSALALALAEREAESGGGALINADSMQVYADWRILSARPPEEEASRAPHLLYGHRDAALPFSVGDWLRDAREALEICAAKGWRPIVVGGTGLYFEALTRGLAEIPPIPPELRAESAARIAAGDAAAMIEDLDDETRAKIHLANPRRVQRAWEVLKGTGRGLAEWGRLTPPPVLPLAATRAAVLNPDRDWLLERIGARFSAMMAEGAADEARKVWERRLPPELPGLQAHGAPELLGWLEGRWSLEEAETRAVVNTRRYAKRQATWFRHRTQGWLRLTEQDYCANNALSRYFPL